MSRSFGRRRRRYLTYLNCYIFILKSKEDVQRKHKKFMKVQLTNNMLHRLENYCSGRYPTDYLTSMKTGSIPLKHEVHHQFRDRVPDLELQKTGATIKT